MINYKELSEFETLYKELQNIEQQIKAGRLPLGEALQFYQKGIELYNALFCMLQTVKTEVNTISVSQLTDDIILTL